LGAVFGAVLLFAPSAGAQVAAPAPQSGGGALRVFYECATHGCDFREFRTQIDWVNWVRDRKDAQLHVIITGQETGSGGRLYQLDFIGLEKLAGQKDRLEYTSLGTDVRDETVKALTRVLSVGLARFSLLAGVPVALEVRQSESARANERLVTSDEVEDPWNFWVFRTGLNLDLSGETSRTNRRVGGSFEASRTTTTWKLGLDAGGSFRRNEIQLSDTTILDTRQDWDVNLEAVYALARHWSLGAESEVSAATRTNQDLSAAVTPELEFSIWPYEEAPRRSLRVQYRVGLRYFNYEERTLFGFLSETRGIEAMEVSLFQRQPWGSTFVNVEASHFLHDIHQYRITSGGHLSFRIVRGLDLRVSGSASWIRDQIFLAAAGATDEEVLLQRKRLSSDFDWSFGLGFSFQFGSIYNNVVNNRF